MSFKWKYLIPGAGPVLLGIDTLNSVKSKGPSAEEIEQANTLASSGSIEWKPAYTGYLLLAMIFILMLTNK